jgi:hypothetical protein
MMDTIELKGRQLIDLPEPPPEFSNSSIRHFGVALDHDEAQEFITQDLRVFGDEAGPYLVVRLRAEQYWPLVIGKERFDVTVEPRRWRLRDDTGVICWLKHIV